MTFSTDKLRSLMDLQNGASAPNRFKVILPRISETLKADGTAAKEYATTEELSILCTAARLPGKNINVVDRNIGLEQLKIATGHVFSDISLTFYLTNSYGVRKYWQEWSECIITPKAPFTVGFHGNYAKPVSIYQLDKIGGEVYGIQLINAYPTSFTEIELNNKAQGAMSEFQVSLTFSNYEIIELVKN